MRRDERRKTCGLEDSTPCQPASSRHPFPWMRLTYIARVGKGRLTGPTTRMMPTCAKARCNLCTYETRRAGAQGVSRESPHSQVGQPRRRPGSKSCPHAGRPVNLREEFINRRDYVSRYRVVPPRWLEICLAIRWTCLSPPFGLHVVRTAGSVYRGRAIASPGTRDGHQAMGRPEGGRG